MSAEKNIKTIKKTFLLGESLAKKNKKKESLLVSLESISSPFLSVAYEGASFYLAKNCFVNENISFDNWLLFSKLAKTEHKPQIHVGLGWAIAEEKKNIVDFIKKIDHIFIPRVLDGFGYYSGLFNRREFVRLGKTPSIKKEFTPFFFQGLGRFFWHISRGDTEKLSRLLVLLEKKRLPDVWRGIGIAFTYVGGTKKKDVLTVLNLSKEHVKDFKCGVVIALHTRSLSKHPFKDSLFIKNAVDLPCFSLLKNTTLFLSSELSKNSLKQIKSFL
ncbi:MAG: hypothetical protein CL844_06755 [Crocinitomicaceae bacterium]|nr:hypothetical protein [Crocinitomicaceae bacterium]